MGEDGILKVGEGCAEAEEAVGRSVGGGEGGTEELVEVDVRSLEMEGCLDGLDWRTETSRAWEEACTWSRKLV